MNLGVGKFFLWDLLVIIGNEGLVSIIIKLPLKKYFFLVKTLFGFFIFYIKNTCIILYIFYTSKKKKIDGPEKAT
jgi:hypothetical protein